MQSILVTGGAGYIGSHVCKALQAAGYLPITFDNLKHGHTWAVKWGPLFEGDLHNPEDLKEVFTKYEISGVIHLAGSIHLRESIENPFSHYYNNVQGTLALFNAMVEHDVKTIVFSSTAAVYAPPKYIPMDEDHPKEPCNPYGRTKWIMEQIARDYEHAHGLHSLALRYFNAAGADLDGEIGEAHDPETHVIPRVFYAAEGKLDHFALFWDQHETPDGSTIRDFIHVNDLANAHVKALKWIFEQKKSDVFNLGTGKGYSVYEIIKKAKEITGCDIPVKVLNKEIKECPVLVADSAKAQKELGWTPEYSDLETILNSAWKWHKSYSPLEV